MGKTKERDPNEGLAADAVLAEDLGDEETRRLAQIAEMGGEIDDDIDNWDDTGLDDGSDLNYVAPTKDKTDDDSDEEKLAGDAKGEDGEPEAKPKEDPAPVEGEAGEEPEGDGDPSVEIEKEDSGSKVVGIPKYRFDEVNERAKSAEQENARLKAEIEAGKPRKPAEEAFDFDAAETKYMESMLDGKTADALATRKEINAAQESKWRAETKAEVRTETNADAMQAELSGLSKEAENLYPVFNEKHADFDADLTDRVLVYYHGYASSGRAKSASDAFVMALADVIQQAGLDEKYGETAVVTDPEPKPTGKSKTDTEKKAAAAKQAHQPVVREGAAADSSGAVVPDIDQMSDEEIEALPPATLARLRGDFM